MKNWREKYSKLRYIVAAVIVLIGIALTPLMAYLAYLERGHFVIGGEYGVLLIAIFMAATILEVFRAVEDYSDRGG